MHDNSIPCLVHRAANLFPDRTAILSGEQKLTFVELEKQVQLLADYFAEIGIRPGEVVQLALPNTLTLILSLLGLMRTGAIVSPINPKFPDRQQNRVRLATGAAWLVGESANNHQQISENMIRQALLNRSTPRYGTTPTPAAFSPLIPCSLILTSGSTGLPKAAALGYRQHYCSASGANALIPLGEGDRNLLSLPVFHIGGFSILFRCLMAGATVVLSQHNGLFEDIDRLGISHVSLVAVQLGRLLDQGAPHSLKHLLIGGGPVSCTLLDRARKAGLHCWHTYGLTEMCSQVYTHSPDGHGHLLTHRQLKLNQANEILVKGDTLFQGYLTDNGQLDLPLDNDGWFATGDLGIMQGDRLDITGRKDNQFISGGENIQPEEIEYFINRMEGVKRSLVVPQPDRTYGFRPVVFIEAEQAVSLRALQKELRQQLPGFKIPVAIYPWLDGTGIKPDRSACRRHAASQAKTAG